ncbi:unnamed protein product [Auanema sp. JU1783]|nr:unnamed protein product [Auanema sp. JU1783]
MGLSPVIYCFEGSSLFVSEGYVAETTVAFLFFHVFYGTLVTVFGTLAQCFFYRYLILCKPHLYALSVTKTGKAINTLVAILFIVHYSWSCDYSLQPSEQSTAFFKKFSQVNYINFEKVAYRTTSINDLKTDISKFVTFLSLLINNFAMFSIISFCAFKIYYKLHSHRYDSAQLVPNAKSHEKVFHILLIQTSIPLISFMAPLTVLVVYVLFKIDTGVAANTFIASAYPFFGICYPLSTLLLVKTYSNFIRLKVFKAPPSSVKVSTVIDKTTTHKI